MHATRRASTLVALLGSSFLVTACGSPAPPTQPGPTPGAPQISCPADLSQSSPDDGPVVVSYPAPVVTDGAPPVATACSPAPGSPFPLGATAVTCTAIDALGRASTCGFSVRISAVPRLRKTRFMAFGDSMTAGVVSVRTPLLMLVPSPTSYPGRLQVLLSERYAAQTPTVDDRGALGEKAQQAVLRLRSLLRSTQPEVVLLLEGANDLNDDGTSAIAATEAAMEAMVISSVELGAIPLLASIPPQRAGAPAVFYPEAVVPYNARLKAIADYYSIAFVDIHAAFGGTATAELIGSDGLHPTEAGYEKMADTFFAAIQATLEVVPPSSARRLAIRR
jgi:lysophospholipase L1-like esterase